MTGCFKWVFMGMDDRGCDYCRDDQNMHYGHVGQVAFNEDKGALLRCPRCGWLYLDPRDGRSEPHHIDTVKAAKWFGFPLPDSYESELSAPSSSPSFPATRGLERARESIFASLMIHGRIFQYRGRTEA